MAKRSKKEERDQDVPEGFDVPVSRERGEGWVKKETGTVVQGRLLSKFSFRGKQGMRVAFQVKLDKPCNIIIGEGDETEIIQAESGTIINVDGSAALMDLEKYAGNGGVYDVWLKYRGMRDLRDGNSMWDIDCRLKVVKQPPKEDVPF